MYYSINIMDKFSHGFTILTGAHFSPLCLICLFVLISGKTIITGVTLSFIRLDLDYVYQIFDKANV